MESLNKTQCYYKSPDGKYCTLSAHHVDYYHTDGKSIWDRELESKYSLLNAINEVCNKLGM